MNHKNLDQDSAKGATETEDHETPGNAALQGQLGHRDQDPRVKGSTGEAERKSA
jgi:hypothetical protein